jgi:hypothetical protein
MPLDISLIALRLQEIGNLARNSLREPDKRVSDQYQQQVVSIADELLEAVEAELRPDAARPSCR